MQRTVVALVVAGVIPAFGFAQGVTNTGPAPAQLVPQGSPLDRDRAPRLPSTGAPLAAPTPAAPSNFAPGAAARIGSVTTAGASVYSPEQLAGLTQGLTGAAVPLSKVEEARQAILARYRGDGYLLTTVSTVLDRNGNLRFNVTEGYIAEVRLQGDVGPAGTQVLRFLQRITEERPVRIATLERYLLLATDIPGLTVRSVLRPSADDPAAVTLIAQVSRKAVDGLIAADNRSFRLTGPEQLLAVGGFNSFSQFGERTEFTILHSFNNTQTFGQAATEFFIGGSGAKLRLYAGAGGVEPSDYLRNLGYDGRTRVFGAQGSYPIIRSRDQSLFAVAALDAIETDINTFNSGGVSVRNSFDSLRILRGGLDYTLQDQLAGAERTGVNAASIRLSQGLNGLGSTHSGDPQAGRPGSRTDFFKVSAEVSRNQMLFRPWADATVALYGLVAGQVSASVLPPSEKFFLGGIRYNRGFYSGEVTGDNAITTAIELQLNTSFPVEAFGQSVLVGAQFYLFHDFGQTWENQDRDAGHRLRSAGGGVRAQLTQYVALEAEGVHRFTRLPTGSAGGSVSPIKGDAAYWRLITRF